MPNHDLRVLLRQSERLELKNQLVDNYSIAVTFQRVFTGSTASGCVPLSELLRDDGSESPWGKVEISPQEQILLIPYSSGTTGLPKGVMLSHYAYTCNVTQLRLVSRSPASGPSLLNKIQNSFSTKSDFPSAYVRP